MHLPKLPQRHENAHKGECGRVAIIGGSIHMMGAPLLSGRAALRTGSGLVVVMTVSQAQGAFVANTPELITHLLNSLDGYLTIDHATEIESAITHYGITHLAIGPGLGQSGGTTQLIRTLIPKLAQHISLVIDADALNAIDLNLLTALPPQCAILTPHPGEFDRLFGQQPDRLSAAMAANQQCQQTIILKGHRSVVVTDQGQYINTTGNPGMATAGSGDVLTGIVVSLMGQGMSMADAAVLGTHLHGLAGDLAYQKYGNSLIASDIIEAIPDALKNPSFI